MRFKFTLTPSDYYHEVNKSRYSNSVEVSNLAVFKDLCRHDFTCAVYKDNHRSKTDFLYADYCPFDIDNDHSDSPSDWVTPEIVGSFFRDVPFLIH